MFRTIADLIESKVIINGKAMFSTSIFEFYNAEFLSSGGASENIESYTAQSLMKKIKERFKERIVISLFDQRKGNFLYSATMSDSDA